MLQGIKEFFYENPFGVFSVFILGFLSIIIIQNIFFYKIYKDKAYLWYLVYLSLIFLDQIIVSIANYYNSVLQIPLSSLPFHTALEWLYNSAYLIFVIQFGGLFLFKNTTAKRIKNIVYFFVLLMFLLFIIDSILNTFLIRYGFIFILVPVLIIISVFIYYYLFQMKTPIKIYIISGSFAFSIFSILALIFSLKGSVSSYSSWSLFYIGVFIENIFFSLGLSKKQSIILEEKNESQQRLIFQLEENQLLKNSLNERLELEVKEKTTKIISLNKIAEKEKIKQLELSYQKEIAELKVSSLQSQMNPHFIFNSLNSIKLNIIKNNKEDAVYYLNKFSKLIRNILTVSREKEVSLNDEMNTLDLYISIENLRFKNEIEVLKKIDHKINLDTIFIPPLILQPFIENAIWHGLSPKEGKKTLMILVSKSDQQNIRIVIQDNGIGRKKSLEINKSKILKRESVGLKLTEERLAIFCKKNNFNYNISFEDLYDNKMETGTKVIIELNNI